MLSRSTLLFGILKIPFDISIIIGGFLLSKEIRNTDMIIQLFHLDIIGIPTFFEYIYFVIFASILFLIVGFFHNLYTFQKPSIQHELLQIIWVFVIWSTFLFAYFFLVHEFFFSRFVLFLSIGLSIFGIFLIRFFLFSLQKQLWGKGYGRENIILIADIKQEQRLIQDIQKNLWIGKLSLISHNDHPEKLQQLLEKYNSNRLLHIRSDNGTMSTQEILSLCHRYGVSYTLLPESDDIQAARITLYDIGGYAFMEIKPTLLDGWGRIIKRFFDIIFSSIALILFSPLFFIITCILLFSGGNILYSSKRIGKKEKLFTMWKFRTMILNAESMKENLISQNERKHGPLFKIKNDPRITPIGIFLRKTSLDEIPQFWNVLKGDMSLIGPRPHLPEEIKKYLPWQKRLLSISPGMTSLASVSGRSSLSFEREAQLDIYYIENWSLFLDISIFFRTIFVVIKQENAS
jgi:exopolysaccharide biosynthesis polyprenyl glycosylphosphotransferase